MATFVTTCSLQVTRHIPGRYMAINISRIKIGSHIWSLGRFVTYTSAIHRGLTVNRLQPIKNHYIRKDGSWINILAILFGRVKRFQHLRSIFEVDIRGRYSRSIFEVNIRGRYSRSIFEVEYSRSIFEVDIRGRYSRSIFEVVIRGRYSRSIFEVDIRGRYSRSIFEVDIRGQYSRSIFEVNI